LDHGGSVTGYYCLAEFGAVNVINIRNVLAVVGVGGGKCDDGGFVEVVVGD
jgi:hypothetical protein